MATTSRPAIEGWFTTDDEPHLLGLKCTECATVTFPPIHTRCPNPGCAGTEAEPTALSRTGTIWSFTDASYQPPPPYISASEGFRPFALAAVELAAERMVVLGQVAEGVGAQHLNVGDTVELVVEPLYQVDGVDHLIYRWRPTS